MNLDHFILTKIHPFAIRNSVERRKLHISYILRHLCVFPADNICAVLNQSNLNINFKNTYALD